MTKIIIERHGQSIGNRDGIYLGHTDLGLTDEGREQARVAAEHLKDEPISRVYSSDLSRAMETAMPHCIKRGIELITRKDLREMFVGDWEGGDVAELRKLHDFTVRRTHKDFVYPGGESIVDAAARMKKAIIDIANENPNSTVLIVSHSAVIRAFWFYLAGYEELNMTDRVPFMKNTAYCVLTYDGVLHQQEYNVCDHVPKTKVLPI